MGEGIGGILGEAHLTDLSHKHYKVNTYDNFFFFKEVWQDYKGKNVVHAKKCERK